MPIVKNELIPYGTTLREQVATKSGLRIGSAYVPRLRADQAGWLDQPERRRSIIADREDKIVLAAVAVVVVLVLAFRLWR